MSQLVTRCPHCSTSFHVNEQQLRAARGAVRCGSCLQVFRADENIVFGESAPQTAGPGKGIEELLEDDDFLIHDDIDLEGEEPAPGKAAKPAPQPPKNERPLIDDAFGEEQWQDLESDAAPGELEDDAAGSWRDEPPTGRRPRPAHKRAGRREEPQRQPRPRRETPKTSLHPSDERERLISAIEPAPLEVAWRPQRDRRLPAWAWTLLALLLVLGLAAQTAYYRFDTLSKREPWRSTYGAICPLLGCQLPPLIDLGAIRTSKLMVRSHPQAESALVVDAVLLNTAPFAQPFPDLQLSFADLKGQPVASRRFQPREYLQGEMAGRRLMPAGSPVHIAIEIVDPGGEAVNYELRIAR